MTKRQIAARFDRLAPHRLAWKNKNRYYYENLERLSRSLIPPGRSVLELGCGTGDLLASVSPRLGVGVDISGAMLSIARRSYPGLAFVQGDAEAVPLTGPFDYIVASDLIGLVDDVWQLFREIRRLSSPATRVLVTSFNSLWKPVLEFGERVGMKMPQQAQNWLGMADIENLLQICDLQVERSGVQLLLPWRVPILAPVVNAMAEWPVVRHFTLTDFFFSRPLPIPPAEPLSCTVVIPCRNEVGNVAGCVERIPEMGMRTEIIFIDGASTDGTPEAIEDVIAKYEGRRPIRLMSQVPRSVASGETDAALMLPQGKGDAVRQAFDAASGDVLMILDADLTVPPEDLPKFFQVMAEGKSRFVNGTRLVYPMENEAMKFLNMIGNKGFSLIFTWLLNQRIKDTLCGTKTLFKRDYERIKANRSYFGDFDPFGDFDLLFGAARLKLPIAEMPVRYRRRVAGETKVRVFKHGILLVRMSLIGFRKFKLRPLWDRITGRTADLVPADKS